jgi:CheY-like chemotaxis protein/anti-sigma regulatory factor (Ser/Thr protein kinase)
LVVVTTVLLVDDVEEVRAVVRQALRLRGGFTVVADVADGAGAIASAGEHQPDIVVLDLGLPDLAGHEVLTRLHEAAPAAQVVIYTGTTSEDLSSGQRHVAAFVRKDRDVRYLVDLVANVSREIHGANVDLGPDLADVARARRFLAERCTEWGCAPAVDDAELVATELVTNALVHASAHCVLRARLAGAVLHIEVEDGGGGTPDVHAADERSEHGRGLLIVSALCSAWGVDMRPSSGKRVWAQLVIAPTDDADRTTLAGLPN